MKNLIAFLFFLLVAIPLIGCSGLVNLVQNAADAETITPSDVVITQERDVSDFNAIEMRSYGTVNITQGESNSLIIEGSDNVVPLIQTTVSNGKLIIDMKENINILGMDQKNKLIFTIVTQDLTGLSVSGFGDVSMESLTTTRLDLVVSGAGNAVIGNFSADSLDITVSGLGNVEIAGSVGQAEIEIPGSGSVNAGDLECQSASVNISGLGDITMWVTDELSGTISGSGSVSYYGDPRTNTNTTGMGKFESLGNK